MIIAFAVNFLSAFWFAIRIFRNQRSLFGGSVGFLTILFGVFCAKFDFMIGMWIISSSGVLFLGQIAYKNCHHRRLAHKEAHDFLDLVILEMRSGRAFRDSILRSMSSLGETRLKMLLSSWISGSSERSESEIIREFSRIEEQSHQALERLLLFRRRFRLESDFRRRFGQVSLQIRMQALIISALFAAIFVFNCSRGAWSHNSGVMIGSLALFSVGLVLIFRLGGRVKWNF